MERNSILEELLKSDALQRLKKIDQSGPLVYFGIVPCFSRYDHSIGVLSLLQRAGVAIEEQVAGLMHDVSHTAFSHIGDHLFYESNKDKSYQDLIHIEFLKQMGVQSIIEKYNIDIAKMDPHLSSYSALERDLPYMCADRIQYVIHTGVIFEYISEQDAKDIIQNLGFKNDNWFFTSVDFAKKFADLSLKFTKDFYSAPWNVFFYEYFTDILRKSIEIGLITIDSVRFGIDVDLIEIIFKSDNSFIRDGIGNISSIENMYNLFEVVDFNSGDIAVKPRFRGIDPFILIDNSFVKLSEIDVEFAERFHELKDWCAVGYGIKILENKSLVNNGYYGISEFKKRIEQQKIKN